MTDYPNWFAPYARPLFEKHLLPLAGKPGLHFLQIGAFTGDASVWLAQNVLNSEYGGPATATPHREPCYLYDVDTWAGSDEPEHESFDWADVERTYDEKTAPYGAPHRAVIAKNKCTSADFLSEHAWPFFDFIYVDGDHTPYGVLRDAVGAYEALKVGGLLAFDDYPWTNPRTGDGPAVAVDAFAACYKGRLQLIQLGAQAWFRKIA